MSPTKTLQKNKAGGPSRLMPVEHLDKVGEIAMYYGFSPMKSLAIAKADIDAAKNVAEDDFVDDETEEHGKMPLYAEEKIALIRAYHEQDWNSLPQPVMFYLKDPCRGGTKKCASCHRYADLEILGTSGPIAEATLIQAGRTMLAAEGFENTRVEINSVGDRDSLARFGRELVAYYRKNINEMTPECRQILKRDAFELLASRDESCKALNDKAPRAMDFLSETSRRHLEEVLEYFEALNIPYVVNNGLIGNRSYCTETIFAIIDATPKDTEAEKTVKSGKCHQHILALGVRYNGLAKRLNVKKDIQGVGLSLLIKGNGGGLRDSVKKVKRPIVSFVQLGLESKLLSLGVVEHLRLAKIPLQLSLAKDRLGAQVSTIEKYHTPYVIVIGKKEAMDKTAIVRRVDTYSQDTVPLSDLADYMKKIEKTYWGK